MAGSYNHVTGQAGELLNPPAVLGMLDCYSGDVYEAIEEMYGMIWELATRLSQETADDEWIESAETAIEDARQNYQRGLAVSPTKRFKETPQ